MTYLEHDAVDTFLVLCARSYDLRLIGRSDYELRLACLGHMIDPNDPLFSRLREDLPSALASEAELVDEEHSEISIDPGPTFERQHERIGSRREVAPPLVMELIVQNVKGMKKWVFHEFDADPHPSVPHGHEFGKKHPKCDPYTGYVYDAQRRETDERLSRKTRIAL